MIIFNTEFAPYFNKKIHQFLLAELFELYTEGDDFDDSLNMFFPKHLIREQKEKCAATMEDLLDWTNDKYWHTMTAFHKVGLYYFLNYVSDLRDDMPEFDSIFYDSGDEQQIKEIWNQLDQELKKLLRTPNGLKKHLSDIETFLECCFDDTDFLMIPDLSNLRSINDTTLERLLGVDFDYYKEILPQDIRTNFETQGKLVKEPAHSNPTYPFSVTNNYGVIMTGGINNGSISVDARQTALKSLEDLTELVEGLGKINGADKAELTQNLLIIKHQLKTSSPNESIIKKAWGTIDRLATISGAVQLIQMTVQTATTLSRFFNLSS